MKTTQFNRRSFSLRSAPAQSPGPSRRSFVRAGLGAGLGALFVGAGAGVSTRPALAAPPQPVITPAKRCVVLFMHGGASQIDTFDPKPGRPTGGEFKAIESSVSGLAVSEHLPGLAARMHQLTLIRSLTAKEGNHERARYLMHTGFAPQGGVVHPGFGAHAAREAADRTGDLPGYVSLNLPGQGPGYLGAAYSPFIVPNTEKPVRNLAPPASLDDARFDRRVELWRDLEGGFAKTHGSSEVQGARSISEQAVAMTRAPELDAFDLERESKQSRARYGEGAFAQGCLMARRLLEAGVPYVEVGMRGWDTHDDIFGRVRTLSAELDRGASALIDDLIASGLWSDTLLIWLGDFGRTPQISGRGGRDHFPRVSSVVLGGGPIRAGEVIGSSDKDGENIAERPVTVPDLFASVAAALGVDAGETHVTPGGRPVTTVDEAGKVISELF
jgi:hypothetical protein